MRRHHLAPILAALSLVGCDRNPSTAPTTSGPLETDSAALVQNRLVEFHIGGSSQIDRANASKSSPADTVDLLPPDLVVPSNLVIRWYYMGESDTSTIDPSQRSRVPLRNGIVLLIDNSSYSVHHNAFSSIPTPTITPATRFMDYYFDSIEITSLRPGAVIHYTLDGSYPTTGSPVYTGKIPLDHPYLMRAMAHVPGVGPSLSATAGYPAATSWNPAIVYDTLIDARDGQVYPTVRMGGRTWMAKNLAWMPPEGTARDCKEGALYDAEQIRTESVCPEGWSVPSRADWDSLAAWSVRQSGVSLANLGNALSSNALYPSYQVPNFVDLFGFRATSSTFWTRDPGADSGTVVLRVIGDGRLNEMIVPILSIQWVLLAGMETYASPGPTLSRVRCLKDRS